MTGPGTLQWQALSPDLVGVPVAAALAGWSWAGRVRVAAIDADLADTATFCTHYGVDPVDSANCVVVAGRRGPQISYAACVALANSRLNVNGVVRRLLQARKASFAPMADAVGLSGMEHGGITPVGMPPGWPIFLDAAVLTRDMVVVGSGLRRSKLALPPEALLALPGAQRISGLAG